MHKGVAIFPRGAHLLETESCLILYFNRAILKVDTSTGWELVSDEDVAMVEEVCEDR